MNKCQNPKCGKETKNPKYCSHGCRASIANLGVRRHGDPTPKNKCFTCGEMTRNDKFCSNSCSSLFYGKNLIESFNDGENVIRNDGAIPRPIRNHILDQANNTCQLCGFHKQNPYTKRWIIEIDHIDGNWKNNTKKNLRVICPNCSAGTSTYKALNTGKGRKYTPTRRKKAGF